MAKICVAIVSIITHCVRNVKKLLNIILFNLYFSIFFLNFLLVLILWPFPILNGRTVRNGKLWARLLKHVSILLGVKWELRNGEVLAKDRGAVIVANHQSILDIVGMFNIWETVDKIAVISKKEVLYAGPFGVIAYFAGVIFIDRKNPKNSYKELQVAANAINQKVKMWIFPEGTRNFDCTKLLAFKKGAFTTAIAAQAPIIPVVFSPYYFIDRKNYTYKKGHAIIQCLNEIPTTGLTMDDVPELTERVRNMMLSAYKKLSDEVMTNTINFGDKKNHVKQ